MFNYFEQVNRLNPAATHVSVTLEVQVDKVTLFANPYYLDDTLRSERTLVSETVFNPMAAFSDFTYVTVEKMRARVEKNPYSLTVGDVFAGFGPGIALNMNCNVQIDVDSSIQVAKKLFRPGA